MLSGEAPPVSLPGRRRSPSAARETAGVLDGSAARGAGWAGKAGRADGEEHDGDAHWAVSHVTLSVPELLSESRSGGNDPGRRARNDQKTQKRGRCRRRDADLAPSREALGSSPQRRVRTTQLARKAGGNGQSR